MRTRTSPTPTNSLTLTRHTSHPPSQVIVELKDAARELLLQYYRDNGKVRYTRAVQGLVGGTRLTQYGCTAQLVSSRSDDAVKACRQRLPRCPHSVGYTLHLFTPPHRPSQPPSSSTVMVGAQYHTVTGTHGDECHSQGQGQGGGHRRPPRRLHQPLGLRAAAAGTQQSMGWMLSPSRPDGTAVRSAQHPPHAAPES
jgi:hypothetical protein